MGGKYKVIFVGLNLEREVFIEKMNQLGVDDTEAHDIVNRSPIILKEGMGLERARRYADTIQDAGGRVVIRENGQLNDREPVDEPFVIASFNDFTMCPECGHKQPKGSVCEKCNSKMSE